MNQNLSVTPTQELPTHQHPNVTQPVYLKLVILSLELLLAIPLGLVLVKLQVGGIAWIFGGLGSGAIVLQGCRIFYQYYPKPNRRARKVGMALVGLSVGASSSNSDLTSLASGVPIFIFLTLFLLLCGGCIGYLYSRLSQTNLLTSMLATVPGGVGVMSSIAADYNRNVTLVALVQAIRVTTVVLLIPLIARTSVDPVLSPQTLPVTVRLLSFEPSQLGLLSLALVITTLVVSLAGLCKMPAAEFFGALVVGLAFNSLLHLLPVFGDVDFSPPVFIKLLGQLLLGITIGEYWGDKPNIGKRAIGYAFMSVAMTLIAGAIAAMLAMQLTSWDWLTCLLVTAPGGAPEMILVSLALNHNVEIVTAGHLVRLIAINSSLPLWIFLFSRLDKQLSDPV
ncbi:MULTISPECIES: AbrB family transcriptional regulator [Cyanophyceae]|uniref:AbrB family transcriptional regulator n=1 Tax=Cyanophyceae TaxID=3028117 RepID=UPI00232D8326|nr:MULTISPECIES: AbrB family transcriptional regulator [Cyanophyceae]MDB9358304.1 AbrB family transcriptional regulator [Nodularia spumigena CS-587/03]MDB9341477.1 AbrB family transcriptional regulator [Nodularia spumigena CS-589/07]MDB9348867.1 AbrB family transcriptional regulator [Nodularia spumigena CS-588/01]MDB9353684.1 AbrB family transcriptional regulator [Nodularia spumigena CS-588/05]MDB9402245.1 AbrB family transcriptional regulator [Microcystis aeruginosa CS-567/02-A1]